MIGGGRRWVQLISCAIIVHAAYFALTFESYDASTQLDVASYDTLSDGMTCDVARFNQQTAVVRPDVSPAVPRALLAGCRHVFYNRVPKCASTTVIGLFDALANTSSLRSIFVTKRAVFNDGILNFYNQTLRNHSDEAFVLSSHFYFYDFNQLVGDIHPVYINIIREPSEWLQSVYYWYMYGTADKPRKVPRDVHGTTTVRQCALSETCIEMLRIGFGPIRYFCGQHSECRSNVTYALGRALAALDQHYVAVGLQGQLGEYMAVVEYLLPHLFTGVREIYERQNQALAQTSQTVKKKPVGGATESLLRRVLAPEYRLYDHVRQRHERLYGAIRRLTAGRSR